MKNILVLALFAGAFVAAGFAEMPADVIGGTAAAANCDTTGLQAKSCPGACTATYQKCKSATPGTQQTRICNIDHGAVVCSVGANCNGANADTLSSRCKKHTPSDRESPSGF